ncbi:hypothetical protein FO519_003764 [Halicephalobus sp. NKZ332]|nr:hypothetical protein FO519_003764 [Halicephalobus sp. NKZ332]
MNNFSRYRSPSNPPERNSDRIGTTDSIGLPFVPRRAQQVENLIFDCNRINAFIPGQHVTIVVIVRTVVSFQNSVTYVNSLTSDHRKVVVKSYGKNHKLMSIKKGFIYKFTNLRVKDVANRFHSDVNVDFIYNNYSGAYYINSESVNDQNNRAHNISESQNLESYVGEKIKIKGTVLKVPIIVGNFYLVEISNSYATSLRIKISPATFLIEAIKQGNDYSFAGELTRNGNYYELQVNILDITSVAILSPNRAYSRWGK